MNFSWKIESGRLSSLPSRCSLNEKFTQKKNRNSNAVNDDDGSSKSTMTSSPSLQNNRHNFCLGTLYNNVMNRRRKEDDSLNKARGQSHQQQHHHYCDPVQQGGGGPQLQDKPRRRILLPSSSSSSVKKEDHEVQRFLEEEVVPSIAHHDSHHLIFVNRKKRDRHNKLLCGDDDDNDTVPCLEEEDREEMSEGKKNGLDNHQKRNCPSESSATSKSEKEAGTAAGPSSSTSRRCSCSPQGEAAASSDDNYNNSFVVASSTEYEDKRDVETNIPFTKCLKLEGKNLTDHQLNINSAMSSVGKLGKTFDFDACVQEFFTLYNATRITSTNHNVTPTAAATPSPSHDDRTGNNVGHDMKLKRKKKNEEQSLFVGAGGAGDALMCDNEDEEGNDGGMCGEVTDEVLDSFCIQGEALRKLGNEHYGWPDIANSDFLVLLFVAHAQINTQSFSIDAFIKAQHKNMFSTSAPLSAENNNKPSIVTPQQQTAAGRRNGTPSDCLKITLRSFLDAMRKANVRNRSQLICKVREMLHLDFRRNCKHSVPSQYKSDTQQQQGVTAMGEQPMTRVTPVEGEEEEMEEEETAHDATFSYKAFHQFVFLYMKMCSSSTAQQHPMLFSRTVPLSMVVKALMATTSTLTPFTSSFCDFLMQKGYVVMQLDQWMNFITFVFETDFPHLRFYDVNNGLPLLYDEYVDWLIATAVLF